MPLLSLLKAWRRNAAGPRDLPRVMRSDLPGRPFLYGTTASFLEHFGLKNLTDLNALDPTLQRSRPAERRAVHRKAKPDKPDASPDGAPDSAPAAAVEAAVEDRDLQTAVREILGPRGEPGADAEPVFEAPPDAESNGGGT
jgi:hypothetical protein